MPNGATQSIKMSKNTRKCVFVVSQSATFEHHFEKWLPFNVEALCENREEIQQKQTQRI